MAGAGLGLGFSVYLEGLLVFFLEAMERSFAESLFAGIADLAIAASNAGEASAVWKSRRQSDQSQIKRWAM